MTGSRDQVSVERFIAAPPEAIFAYLSDADRHQEIDGSGTVRGVKGDPVPLQVGTRFGMSMKMGLPYSMVNEVVELEPNRRIAWQTRGPGPLGRITGGRIWRYELEPRDGGTLVRETWDISQETAAMRPIVRKVGSDATRRNMEATLARLDQLVTSP